MRINDKSRTRAGVVTSAVGIVCNLLLAAAKITVGALFGLLSVMADGFNNLSDCGSGAVSLVSFRIAEKPADKEHPYGHRRAEYVAAMIIGFIVLFLAVELLRESIEKTVAGVLPDSSVLVYIVLAASIAVKGGMFVFYRVMAKRLQSDTLRAAATDSACDCLATLAVIVGALLAQFASLPADGWAGLAVALFIGWQGVKILLETGSKLLGQAPDKALVDSIRAVICAGEGVLGVHDLKIYGYGKGAYFATIHVEMSSELDPLAAHAVIDGLECKVREELGVELCAHLDPIDLSDGEAITLGERLKEGLSDIAEGLEIHDLRLVRGAKTKVIFDAGVPFSCKKKDGEIRAALEERLRALGDFEPLITVERE